MIQRAIHAAVFAVSLAGPATAFADDQDVIDYRRHVMKTMGEEVASLRMIIDRKAPAESFAAHARVLAITATMAKKAFEPKVSGGDAKPEVWANWADFARRLDTLVSATDDLAKLAQSGGVAAAGPKFDDALSCKGCHDRYRIARK